MNDNILEIKDLAIHFYTEDGDVAAVNGIDLALRHGTPWDWWGRRARARPPRPKAFSV